MSSLLFAMTKIDTVSRLRFSFSRSLSTNDDIVESREDEQHLFTKHMKDAVFMIPKPSLLVEAVSIIDEIYSEIERDLAAAIARREGHGG